MGQYRIDHASRHRYIDQVPLSDGKAHFRWQEVRDLRVRHDQSDNDLVLIVISSR